MKVTETRLDTLIDNLNTLICEDDLLTRQERETLVRAVAAIGAMKARVSMKKPTVPAASKPKEEKQAPVPDPRFPNARQAWVAEEETLWHCCKVSDEAAFCLIQRPYISKNLLT
ncbi:hypothetical protein POV10_26690, partial [Klebsiella pneumoniae]